MINKQSYDVVIVGAGLVGSILALALAELGLSVCVIEKRDLHNRASLKHIDRALTLNLGTWRILSSLGLLDPDICSAAVGLDAVLVSVQKQLGFLRLTAESLSCDALGYVLDFSLLQGHCWDRLLAHDQIAIASTDAIVNYQAQERRVCLSYLASGSEQSLSATWLIACDGTHSVMRNQWLHIDVKSNLPDVVCLSAIINPIEQGFAVQRFTRSGILALLPSHHSDSARLMWTMSAQQAEHLLIKDHSQLIDLANTLLGRQWAKIDCWETQATFEVPWLLAKQTYRDRALLMGNAQHSIYPTAAQGFNLAMRDVAVLLQTMMDHQRTRGIVQVSSMLEAYHQRNRLDQQRTIVWVQRAHELMHCRTLLSPMAKTLGLISSIPICKRYFAQQFMGLNSYAFALSGSCLKGEIGESIQLL